MLEKEYKKDETESEPHNYHYQLHPAVSKIGPLHIAVTFPLFADMALMKSTWKYSYYSQKLLQDKL